MHVLQGEEKGEERRLQNEEHDEEPVHFDSLLARLSCCGRLSGCSLVGDNGTVFQNDWLKAKKNYMEA